MNIKLGNPWPSGALSNLAPHKFTFRQIECNSMEGLLQGLKFKNPEMQKQICTLVGFKAKSAGRNKNWYETQTLWWQGIPIKRNSNEYQLLLDEAYLALFTQNDKAKNALMSTGKATLTHSIGKRKQNETILTQQEFCSRLTKIRDIFNVEQFITLDKEKRI
jgi:hypothetical protein